ncbi:MAG: hypothetical protein WCT27_05105 [Patescibacteria group bacterium]|jgi:hypothetical protein
MGEIPGYNPEAETGIDAKKAIQSNVEPVNELPGRSFLENPEFKNVTTKPTAYEDGRSSGWVAEGLPANQSMERVIKYHDEKGVNTDSVKSIYEDLRTVEVDDGKTKRVKEVGHDIHQVNGWEKTSTVTDGQLTMESGRTTEGEKAGETWETKHSVEQKGRITKKTREATGQHWVDGVDGKQLVPFRTLKVNFTGANGEHILYRSREFDDSGKEIEGKMMEDIGEEVPPDFQEW